MLIKPVAINTATANEIATLYDVSTRRAAAVVAYRQTHGPFHGPTDLARVIDISEKLAFFLDPHIDWRVPAEPIAPKVRSWFDALIWGVVLLCLLPATLLFAIWVIWVLSQGMELEPYRLVAALCGIGALFGFSMFAALRMGVAVTRSRDRAQWLASVALGTMALALSVGIPTLLAGGGYWWFVSGSAANFSTDQLRSPTAVGLVALCFLYLLMVPQLIVWWRPQLADARWLAGIFDSAFLLAGLLLTLGLRVQIGGWSPWFLLLAAVAGVMLITVAIFSLRRGESFLGATLDFLQPQRLKESMNELAGCQRWLDQRLLGSAEQRQLQTLLNTIYRQQTNKALLGSGLGGWIVVTAVSAILQLYAQDWWRLLLAWVGS